MSRIAGLLFLLTAASAALLLFYVKQQVREMEKELELVHRGILDHQVAIRSLKRSGATSISLRASRNWPAGISACSRFPPNRSYASKTCRLAPARAA